jgi:hypothetical protein
MAPEKKDPEVGRRVGGYPRLADVMGGADDFVIFKRFGSLSAENLLYLQAELDDLKRQLGKARDMNRTSGNADREEYEYDWDTLRSSTSPAADEGNDGTQWALMLRIRKVMKEYCKSRPCEDFRSNLWKQLGLRCGRRGA